MTNSLILIILACLTMFMAALFAGAETGIYQISRIRLRLGIERKKLSFIILGKALRDSPALLISLLLGTNLAHYLTTGIVTYLCLRKFQSEHTAELLATVITVPTLFIFCELIPKNLFYYRADSLLPPISPVIYIFNRLGSFCGIVPLLKSVSNLFAKLAGSTQHHKTAIPLVHKPHIRAILRESREEGFLSTVQTDMLNRIAGISNLSIRSVMIPVARVRKVPVNCDKTALLSELKKYPYTRRLVYNNSIIGYINIYDVLNANEDFTTLQDMVKPIGSLTAGTTVTDAINFMQSKNHKIILVTHPTREKPLGILTMKDLVEELLGELTEW
ncbi:CNNM domain-containing protein [Planctomycetota bacterium]